MVFKKRITDCMLSPEMQRLREVRLGNINSLCITGSANINRFEHSVGTAYLAMVNIEANKRNFPSDLKDCFVLAALFHDLANGPFGHSYEYIVERQGFNPEKSIGDVIFRKKQGSHKSTDTCESFYLGLTNELSSILRKEETKEIDRIVKGENEQCSKILNSEIDIDNIDNVYRMAFHMGIDINKKAPIELAKGIVCRNGEIFFKNDVIPYLYDWYETRRKVYKLLLYNPQDFAAKCMLAEVMDYALESDSSRIEWQFTDDELIRTFLNMKEEIWDDAAFVVVKSDLDFDENEFVNEASLRSILGSVGFDIPNNAKVVIESSEGKVFFRYYNTEFMYEHGILYKKTRKVLLNPAKLTSRLMRGDLYSCIGIFVTKDVDWYNRFLNREDRFRLEAECNSFVEKEMNSKEFSVCFHAILDKNKTNRQLDINLLSGECLLIGQPTHDLIIGAFLKNTKFGLAQGGISDEKRKKLEHVIWDFLTIKDIECFSKKLYEEVDEIE